MLAALTQIMGSPCGPFGSTDAGAFGFGSMAVISFTGSPGGRNGYTLRRARCSGEKASKNMLRV